MVYDDYMLWLFCVKNMWQKKIEALLTYFQTPENIYKASETILEKSNCIKAKDIAEIMESRKKFDIQKERKKLEDLNIQFITEKSELFPKRLLNISDRPRALFVRGQGIEFLNGPSAAIIGARVCSPYGIYTAQKFSRELACCQVNIISGLARGIDSAAHAGALEGEGRTYAVLGCGADICYPPENKELYDRIQKTGAVLSEYPPATKPAAWQFPQRNRIISGLSDCVVITEAKQESGSLITANHALEKGIDVCAVPGRINDPLSQGCNRLIREGAIPVLDTSDLLAVLGISYKNLEKKQIFLEKKNEVVYSILGFYLQSIDEIAQKTNLKSGELHYILLQLQLAGLVEEPVKNCYIRKK